MSNQYYNKNAANFESEPSIVKDLPLLPEPVVELCDHPTVDALSRLRGDPDHFMLLNVLYDSVRCIESEPFLTDPTAPQLGPVLSEDILPSLCNLLVHGSDTTVQTDADEDADIHEDFSNGVDTAQNNEDASTEEGRVFPSIFNWRKNIQLRLPLYSPSTECDTFCLARQIVQGHYRHDTPWFSDLIIPLYKRWQSEERLRFLQSQQQDPQCQTADAEKAPDASSVHKANKQLVNSKASSWMKELLSAMAACVIEQVISYSRGTCDAVQGCSDGEDLIGMLGLLSRGAHSYPTLCAGAAALLAHHWIKLARDVRQYFADATSGTPPPTSPARSAGGTGDLQAGGADGLLGWLAQRAAVQHCAQRHAIKLWRRWLEYFSKYDYTSCKPTMSEGRGTEVDHSPTAVTGPNIAETQERKDRTSPTVLTESQWLFLHCLVLHAEGFLQGKNRNTEKQGVNCWSDAAGGPVDLSDVMMWAMQCFVRKLLATFQDMANTQIDLCVQENLLSADGSSPFSPSHNRVIIRDFFWEIIQRTEVQAAGQSQDASSKTQFWRSLFLLYTQLTAMQAPNEEVGMTSLGAIGNSGNSARDDGHHMLEDVLHSMQEAYFHCSERALRESAERLVSITKGLPSSETQAKAECARTGEKRRRGGSPIRERDTRSIAPMAGDAPDAKLNRYLSRVFYSVYHPSCFQLLLLERQKQLSTLLLELHSLLVEDAHHGTFFSHGGQPSKDSHFFAVDSTKWQTSDDEEDSVRQDAGVLEVPLDTSPQNESTHPDQFKTSLMRVACRLLVCDARFTLMLSHAVLVLLERRGRVAEDVGSVLTAALIPTLVTLSTGSEMKATRNSPDLGLFELHGASGLGHSVGGWSRSLEATFCVYALIHSELLMALPWSVEGVYLSLARYRDLTRYLLQRFGADPAACITQLKGWIEEGGGAATRPSATAIGILCDGIDNAITLHDPVLRQLKSRAPAVAPQQQQEKGATASFIVDECMRRVTPLFMPPPCGTLLVLAFSRRLTQQMYCLRNAYEMQRRLVEGDDALEYLGRRGIFCTAEDVKVFKVTVQVAHRMIFATRLQPMGLLQLWISMLAHLFTHVVPMAENDEGMELMPRSWQLRETVLSCFDEKVPRTGWRALRPPSRGVISSQTTLRVVLGELLAELFLMPVSDSSSTIDSPHAFPVTFHSSEWWQEQRKSQMEVQRVLPHAVLEVLCLLLKVNTDVSDEELARLSAAVVMEASGGCTTTPPGTPAADGHSSMSAGIKRLEENSFLGLAGLVALCKQIESEVVAGTFKDVRLVHLLRCIWAVADLSALEW